MATEKTTKTESETNVDTISNLNADITNELLHLKNLHEIAQHIACNSCSGPGAGQVLVLMDSMGPRAGYALEASDKLEKLQMRALQNAS